MQESGMIAAYAELLAGKLAFNPSLSRRVRQEVQDHLWEAAGGASANGREAVQRAIANFGDPHVIATQFATAWLARQTWKVGITVILVEHHMKAIMAISDRIIVLNYGVKIADGVPQDVVRNRDVIGAYLGEQGP